MAVTGIILVASGVLLAVVGRLAATGRIKRNEFLGIRTKRSKADDESWRIVHQRAQPWMHASGAALLVTGAAVLAIGSDGAVTGLLTLAGVLVCMVFALLGVAAGHRGLARRDLPR
ncbi:SdpI family protein [Actinomadura chokoriensis]|uniref:SdpI family protein n=1 Tax=Actinomadura chokoriensis TaxID=454156 RepID=UPI0031F9257E